MENVLNLDLNEFREVFFWRGRGRSFHVHGPKMEKDNSGKPGTRNLEVRVSETEQRVSEGV